MLILSLHYLSYSTVYRANIQHYQRSDWIKSFCIHRLHWIYSTIKLLQFWFWRIGSDTYTVTTATIQGSSQCQSHRVPEIFQHGIRSLNNFWTDEAEVKEVDQVDEKVARKVLLQDLSPTLFHKFETRLWYLAVSDVAAKHWSWKDTKTIKRTQIIKFIPI